MPELPEVESFTEILRERAVGHVVDRVEVLDGRILDGATAPALARALEGGRLEVAARRGKWAFLGPAGGPLLALHFGMTGSPWPLDPGDPLPRHARLLLRFAGGAGLALDDPRMFGGVALAESVETFAVDRRLGPDALDAGPAETRSQLARRRGALKAALLDQSVLAGIGNLYADEILWAARLSPRRGVETLDAAEATRLVASIRRVLRKAVEKEADYGRYPRGWLLHRRGEPGAPCPRCGRRLSRATVAGRTTVWCAGCQK